MDLQHFASQEFRGLQRPALVAAARILEPAFNVGNMSDENLRAWCMKKYEGTYGTVTRSLRVVFPAPPTPEQGDYQIVNMRQMPPPGLNGVGKWGGRRRLVTLAVKESYRGQIVRFRWEETCEVELRPNVKTAVPWPIWDMLCNQERILDATQVPDPYTGHLRSQTVEYIEGQWPVTDHGDDPETAKLPRSISEFYQWQALSNHYFRKAKRHEIEDRLAILTDGMKNRSWCRDRTDAELREHLMELLGFHDVINAELEATANAERAQEQEDAEAREREAEELGKKAA